MSVCPEHQMVQPSQKIICHPLHTVVLSPLNRQDAWPLLVLPLQLSFLLLELYSQNTQRVPLII